MPILSNLIVRIGASTTDFDKQVDRSLGKVKRFAADVTAAGSALAIGFSAPLIAAGAAAIKAGSDMESLTMGLKAVMKSSEATTAEMAKLREVAKLPGLGLEEAVKGSIRLQILGNSAEASRRIMRELGNALAVVGGGREDFNEVIRQLSQLGAVGKVTKENLDPIIERIPQLAAIIKEKFGAEALGDPAKTFERMGISAQQFIAIITDELAKGERAGNTYKNSWENIQMAAKDTAAEFGKTLLPIAQTVLDDFLTPGIEKAKAMATAFSNLSKPTQEWAVGLAAAAAAAPLAVVALGTLAENATILLALINKLGITTVAAAGTWAVWAAAIGVAVKSALDMASALYTLSDATDKQVSAEKSLIFSGDKLSESLIKLGGKTAMAVADLSQMLSAGVITQEEYNESLLELARTVYPEAEKAAKKFGAESGAAIAEWETRTSLALKKVTAESQILSLKFTEAKSREVEILKDLNEITKKYGALTVDAARKAAEALDLLFISYRQLSDAPEIAWNKVAFGDIPKAQMPTFPGDPEAYKKTGVNIRPDGMQTKEQYEAMKSAAKSSAQAQSTAVRAVSLAVNDLAQNLAKSIKNWEGLGKAGRSALDSVSEFLLRSALEKQLTRIGNQILKMTQDTGALGKVLGAVFGGGSSVGNPVIKNAAGGASTAASSGGGAASAVGAASSSITGMISAVTGAVSAVSGIIGNFQFAAMNKTLDLIEKEVRYSQIHLLHTLEKANEYWPYMKACWESLVRMETRQMAVGAGGAGVVINVNGGDPKQVLDEITRTLKQYGIIPKN